MIIVASGRCLLLVVVAVVLLLVYRHGDERVAVGAAAVLYAVPLR